MSEIIIGSGHAPVAKGGICTPSDGYRVLAANILIPAVKETASGDTEIIERGLSFLLSKRAETCFTLLDINPNVAIEAILKENGLELANGNGAR